MRGKNKLLRFLPAIASILLAGCTAMGPGTVARDRFDYTRAIADSWKSQMLVNIVGIRYGEAPIFLDVVSVINQYEAQTQANVGASWQSPLRAENNINANTFSLGASGIYTDRPTISYSPMAGDKFATSLLKPIPPSSIFSLIQSGFPVGLVFLFSVQSVNGLHNRYSGVANVNPADPDFHRMLEKWRSLQASGSLALRVQKADGEESLMVIFKPNLPVGLEKDSAELKSMLGLDPQKREFTVVYGASALNDREIAILSRSVLQIMIDLASHIEVPEAHVLERRVAPTFKDEGHTAAKEPLIRVHSSRERPLDAFASAPYQGWWFWIDNKDLPSKQVFSFLTLILTLSESGGKAGAPIVTIPTR